MSGQAGSSWASFIASSSAPRPAPPASSATPRHGTPVTPSGSSKVPAAGASQGRSQRVPGQAPAQRPVTQGPQQRTDTAPGPGARTGATQRKGGGAGGKPPPSHGSRRPPAPPQPSTRTRAHAEPAIQLHRVRVRVRNSPAFHYSLPQPRDWLGALPGDVLLNITQFFGVKAALTVFQALTRRCASYALSRLIGGDHGGDGSTSSGGTSSVGSALELHRLPPQSILLALQYLPPQTRLDFSRCRSLPLDSLPSTLSLRALTSLSLRDCPVPTAPLHALLSACPALKTLDLTGSGFTDATAEALTPASALWELSVADTRIRGGGLVTVLRLCPHLRRLDARKVELTPPAAAALRAHPTLEEVDLSESKCRTITSISSGRGVIGKAPGKSQSNSDGGGADLQFHARSPLHTLRWLKCPGTKLLVAAPRLRSLTLDNSQLWSLQLDTPALESLSLGGCKSLHSVSLLPPTGGAERDWATAAHSTAVIGSSNGFPTPFRAVPLQGPLLPRLLRLELRGVTMLRGYLPTLWSHAPQLRWVSLRDGAQWRTDLDVAARQDALVELREMVVHDWDGVAEGTVTRLTMKTSRNTAEDEERAAAIRAVAQASSATSVSEPAERESVANVADPAAALFADEAMLFADVSAAPLGPPPNLGFQLVQGPQPWAPSLEWGRGAALVPQGTISTWGIVYH